MTGRINLKLRSTAAMLLFLCSSVVCADDHKESDLKSQTTTKISGKFEFGVATDSNVTVSEIDSETGERDSLWTFSADVDLKKKVSAPTEITVGLSHTQDRFENFNEFDLSTNLATAEVSHKLNKITLGTAARYITADLDSQRFLAISQASLNVSGRLSKRVFLRSDYTYSDTEFDELAERDNTRHSLSADLYLFLDEAKRYVTLGYQIEDEDAADAQFDRQSNNVKLRYRHTFPAFDQSLVGQFKASYRRRDYDALTPSIGVIREDERFRVGADLTWLLSETLSLMLEYEYSDYQSNLPAADYEQSVLALKLGWQMGK